MEQNYYVRATSPMHTLKAAKPVATVRGHPLISALMLIIIILNNYDSIFKLTTS